MYKKLTATFLCATILGSGLYAENKPFVGLEIGYATVQGDVGGGFFSGDVIRDYEGSDI